MVNLAQVPLLRAEVRELLQCIVLSKTAASASVSACVHLEFYNILLCVKKSSLLFPENAGRLIWCLRETEIESLRSFNIYPCLHSKGVLLVSSQIPGSITCSQPAKSLWQQAVSNTDRYSVCTHHISIPGLSMDYKPRQTAEAEDTQ